MGQLENKIAVVTGAGQGLGLAMAKRFVAEGATVVMNDINEKALKASAAELAGQGFNVMLYIADVTDSSQVNAMFEAAVKQYGRLDISVHNAGFALLAEAWEATDEDWERLIKVNLTAHFYCVRAALRPMMKQKSGKIINMSSICGRVGRPYVNPGYSAAKAGIVGLTMSVAQSVASYGIQVNAIAPGPIRTELQSNFPEEKMKILKSNFPLGWGTREAVANAVVFLATAEWLTGSVLDINGGHLMG